MPTGKPVPPGVRSAKIYVTNLINPLLPLIRYEITDEVTVLNEPCACGSAFTRVADIQGRNDDVFVYANGIAVHPHVFRSRLAQESDRQRVPGAPDAQRCRPPAPSFRRSRPQSPRPGPRVRISGGRLRAPHCHRASRRRPRSPRDRQAQTIPPQSAEVEARVRERRHDVGRYGRWNALIIRPSRAGSRARTPPSPRWPPRTGAPCCGAQGWC